MNQKDYGEKYKDHLLEQYKLYVEMTTSASARRSETTRFYYLLHSALLVLIGAALNAKLPPALSTSLLKIMICILGFGLSLIWAIHIWLYRSMTKAKFLVIHQMEKNLPFNPYERENWRYGLTSAELVVPFLFMILYFVLACFV